MIKEVIMSNLKKQTCRQSLTGRDIIIGRNGAGKTTRLQTIGIALLGYVPGNGKLAAETFKLSSGQAMIAGIKTEDIEFARVFSRSETNDKEGNLKVTVSQDIMLTPSKGEKTLAQKEARIMAEVGNFPVMLDFNEFLSLSDSKRREFFYKLSGISDTGWDKERIGNYLREQLLTMELEVNNQDKYRIMEACIEDVLNQYPMNYDVQTGLQSMLEYANSKTSYWKKEKQNAEGAVKKIAELKNQLVETDRNIANNKRMMDDLQKQLVEVSEQIAKDTEKKRQIDMRLERIEVLKKEIADLESQKRPDNADELKDKMASLVMPEKQRDYEACISKNRQDIQDIKAKQAEIKKEIEALITARAESTAKINSYESLLERIETQGGVCVLDSRIKCDKDFSKFIEFAKSEVSRAQAEEQESVDAILRKQSDVSKLEDEIKQTEAFIDVNLRDERAYRDTCDRIRREKFELEKQLEVVFNFETLKGEKLQIKTEELSRLENLPVDPIAPIDIAEKRKSGLQEQIRELKAKLEEQERAKATLTTLKSSMIDSKTAMYQVDCWKYTAEALGSKGIQGEIVKGMLEPIRHDVQNKLMSIGNQNEFYFSVESETGKEIFQFGWRDKFGDCRNFDALSTGEKLLLLIALMVTVIEKADPALKILTIDNIENLDSVNFANVLQGLNIIGSNLDNIIIAGVVDSEDIPADMTSFKVWNLSEAANG